MGGSLGAHWFNICYVGNPQPSFGNHGLQNQSVASALEKQKNFQTCLLRPRSLLGKRMYWVRSFQSCSSIKHWGDRKLSGTESRIANHAIPRIAGEESPESLQQEAQKWVEAQQVDWRKIASESPIQLTTSQCLAATLGSHNSSRAVLHHPILASESPTKWRRRCTTPVALQGVTTPL